MNFISLSKNIVDSDYSRFFIVGLSSVAIDYFCYHFLIDYVHTGYAKAISFILGSIFAYVMNNFWTFEAKVVRFQNIAKFSMLYLFSLTLNVFANDLSITVTGSLFLSFLFATSISTVVNFIGQKFWVFK
ncbi:GtrA family protein [Photobacterium chitinilyticum]|uniref:GtrA family protein n=1 Tax=Photobacterium chitinilyticum TaxID=2485123 RepID=UPI003D14BB3F